jgi:hypothetical protein|tara:strand:- start:367 stop:609 length:243 start_codon:yes stop_codon:yes gene_type:complete
MEYVLGPVLALAIGAKLVNMKLNTYDERLNRIENQVERLVAQEVELPKKLMATMMPITTAVRRLNTEVGIQSDQTNYNSN